MFDWNDARYFLAVAESGSTLAAGRMLRVSQTTVARRIVALEEALGLTLFDRRRSGYVLTPAGEALLGEARGVAAAAGAMADAAAARARDTSGVVRLTTADIFAVSAFPPILGALRAAHPEIMIDLDASEDFRDLAAGQADVAFRVVVRPEGGGLVARRIADDLWTIYCSRGYAEANGVPRNRRELHGHPIIAGGGGKMGRVYREWLRENDLESSIALEHGSETGLLSAVKSGLGLAALPMFAAELDPELVRCLPPKPGTPRGLWLLTHERLRHTPRVRVVMDFLAERLTTHWRRIEARLAEPVAVAGL